MAETKSNSIVIDPDMLDSIQHYLKYLSLLSYDHNNMRLRQVQTGIGPATDLIVPIELSHPDTKENLKGEIVFNITDYSKF